MPVLLLILCCLLLIHFANCPLEWFTQSWSIWRSRATFGYAGAPSVMSNVFIPCHVFLNHSMERQARICANDSGGGFPWLADQAHPIGQKTMILRPWQGFRGFFLWGLKKSSFLRRSQSKHLHWRALHHAIELVVQSCWSLRATRYRSAICFDQTWQAMARLIARKGVLGQQKLFLFFIMFANGLGIASSNCTQYQWRHAKVLSVRRYQQW